MYELEALTAPALRRLIDGGVRIAVVPFGSIEHQGPHLAIGADAILADAVGRELTSVMLALRPDTVQLETAGRELRAASAERGARHLERFVAGVVAGVPAVG